MHFLRYQEYYESPSPKFRNHTFTIVDYMEWYSKTFGKGSFTYPVDWGGFNVPSYVLRNVLLAVSNGEITDPNKYDTEMQKVWLTCCNKYQDENFYIIGSVGTEGSTMRHEIAHGFFYIIPEYKKEMTKLVKELNPFFRKDFYENLKVGGYTKQVYVDELQAYMATGTANFINVKLNGSDKPFIQLYEEFYAE